MMQTDFFLEILSVLSNSSIPFPFFPMKNTIIKFSAIIVVLFVLILVLALAFSKSEPLAINLDAKERIAELEANIEKRSGEWAFEQQYATRGRIAQERMNALNRQNNIDREELSRLRENPFVLPR